MDHDCAALHVAPDGAAGRQQRREIRLVRIVDRSGNGDHDEIGFGQPGRVAGDFQHAGALEILPADLAGQIAMLAEMSDL